MSPELGRRVARGAPVALATAVILIVLLSLVAWVATGTRPMPVSFGRSLVGVFGLVLSPICYAALGGIIAAVVPRNPIGWIFLAVSVTIGMMLPINLLVASIHEGLGPAPAPIVWAAWLRTAFGAPLMLALLVVVALIFPDGRPLGGRWRLVVLATAVGGGVLVWTSATDPRGLWPYPTLPNPAAVPYSLEPVISSARVVAVGLLVPSIVLAVASLWLRYRRGNPLLRAQLRWVWLAASVCAVAALPYIAARYVVWVDEGTGEALAAVAQVGSCALPLAAAFAISKYRLFDVDVLIGRALVYLPLTAVLGGLYTAAIALFQRLFVSPTGEASDIAVVVSVLMVATAFTPVRRTLEAHVERRFPAGATARRAEPQPGTAIPRARVLPVTSGDLDCPLGGDRSIADCLACPRLGAVVPGPTPAIICLAASEP